MPRKTPRKNGLPDPREQFARNRHIVALAYDGKNSLAWIGRKYGITRQRVAQIVRSSWNGPLPRKQGRKKYITRF